MLEALKTQYENELQYLQSIFKDLNIEFNESIMAVKIDNAYTSIRNYLRLNKADDVSAYFTAAVELETVYYNNYIRDMKKVKGETDIVQLTNGSVSNTFSSTEISLDRFGLTASVKAILPHPPIRAF